MQSRLVAVTVSVTSSFSFGLFAVVLIAMIVIVATFERMQSKDRDEVAHQSYNSSN